MLRILNLFSPSFSSLADHYLTERPLRPSWRREVDRLLAKELAALHRPSRRDVAALLNFIAAPSVHNHCLAIVGAVYRHGIATGRCEANPADGLRRRAMPARDRTLSEAELASVWNACGDDDHGRIVKLLVLTGCRCSEVGGLLWSEVNLDKAQLELPAARCKNHRAHLVLMSPVALELLPPPRPNYPHVFGRLRGRGFSGWSKGKALLDARLEGMAPFVLHDIRRSCVTIWNELGLAPPHIIELAINHVSGHRAGIAGTYNRSHRLEERRALAEKWVEQVRRIVGA